jgi:hypothetical protein
MGSSNNAAVKHEYNHNYLRSSQPVRPLIRLHSSESQHLLCDFWFFERLSAIVWVLLAIADWHTGFANVAVSRQH